MTRSIPSRLPSVLAQFRQDARVGVRMLRRSPGFTLVAVLTLTLAIGATTAIFSVVNAVLLEGLPYPGADRLVLISTESTLGRQPFAAPDFVDFVESSTAFEEVAAFHDHAMVNFWAGGRAEQVRTLDTSANLLSVYGLNPHVGRAFRPDEAHAVSFDTMGDRTAELPTGPAMLSYGFWMTRFGGDPDIVGARVRLEFMPYEIIGVTPPGFAPTLPDEPEGGPPVQVWTLSRMDFRAMPRDVAFVRAVGRLRPGVTLAQAQADAERFAAGQRATYAARAASGFRLDVAPLHTELTRGLAGPVLVLFGAVTFVLLIACVNLVNLLLARTAAREHELAVRLALGCGRGRVVRQLLTESLLYSLLGAGGGLLLAIWLIPALVSLAPQRLQRVTAIELDGAVLGFALATSFVTTALIGLLPAIRFSRSRVAGTLRATGRGPIGGRSRWDGLLVVGEVGLSMILVIGTVLMFRTVAALQRGEPGFRTAGVMTAELFVPSRRYARYPSAQPRVRFARGLAERVARIPGVDSVGMALVVPLGRQDAGHTYATDRMAEAAGELPPAKYRPITPGYFETASTRLLAGRDFTWTDLEQDRQVAIVDATLAANAWPGDDPIGKRVRIETWSTRGGGIHLEPVWTEVIGVAERVRSGRLDAADIDTVYLPYSLYAVSELSVLVRTTAAPTTLVGPMRESIRDVDPELALFNFRPMETFVDAALAPRHFSLTLLGAFGSTGLLLALLGLYGVLSYSVRCRVREIGIRQALGATSHEVLRLVLGQGLRLAALGLAAGLTGALILAPLLRSELYGVEPADPATLAGVCGAVFLVSLLASYLPARRATRLDPLAALRDE